MLQAVHPDHVDYACETCGQAAALPFADLRITEETVTTPACTRCGSCASLRLLIPDHELGRVPHPGSLVGHRFADTGGVVREHTHGYSLERDLVAHRQLHRDLAAALEEYRHGR